MDTALGILSRSLQGSPASGTSSTTASSKSSDVFASLFSQFAGNQALQASQMTRTAPLPTPTVQTLPSDPRPAPDYSSRPDSAADSSQSSKADDPPAAKSAQDDDNDHSRTDHGPKAADHGRSTSKAGKTARTDKAGKDQKAGKADKTDDSAATDAQDKADAKNQADKTDAKAAADDDQNAADAKKTGDNADDAILAVMPMAAQPLVAAKQTPTGDGAAVKGGPATGKGVQGPAAKTGPQLKGVDPRQVAAGPTAGAGEATAGAQDGGADDANSTLQNTNSALNGFAAALTGTGGAPGAQAAALAARGIGEATPQTTAAQLVQAVEAGDGGGSGDDAKGGLTGEGGSGGAQSGASARVPDGSQIAGGTEGARQSGGADFASTLASVRSARPGMAAGATDQVAVQLQHSAQDGNGSISMQLRPEELGRIDIKLDIDQQGLVNATITADRPQTLELLQRDSRSLEKALQDAGLQTDSGSLSFNLRGESGQGSNQQNNQGDGGRPNHQNRLLSQLDDTKPADLAVVTRRYQVPNGRIDVRI